MTTLEQGFEEKLKQAVLDDVEAEATAIGKDLRDTARAKWIAYAARNGYAIDHIWSDVRGPFVERDADGVTIRLEWPGLTALFEWGVSPHTIDGNPLLHFYWEEIGQWIQTESVDWGSETGGIPEARAIRGAVDEVGREL